MCCVSKDDIFRVIWNIFTRLYLHRDDKVSCKGQDIYQKIYHHDEGYVVLFINKTASIHKEVISKKKNDIRNIKQNDVFLVALKMTPFV